MQQCSLQSFQRQSSLDVCEHLAGFSLAQLPACQDEPPTGALGASVQPSLGSLPQVLGCVVKVQNALSVRLEALTEQPLEASPAVTQPDHHLGCQNPLAHGPLRAILDLPSLLFLRLLFLISCILLLASCLPAPTPTPPPTHTPTPPPTPTSPPSSTPTLPPTHTPTPVPTLDPAAVATTVAAGEARLGAAGVEPLCLRWEDTDGDGEPEWVGLHLRPEEPPRLAAFVLDGDAWHDLRPLEKEPGKEDFGLGEYPTCELEVRDVNADGRVEILIWGHAEASTGLLHIFVWDGAAYALLAPFEGEAGLRLENTDGDLADEVSVAYKYGAWGDLVWEAVHTWDGANYAWTWERYAWFYLDRPHAYRADVPKHAVISFYLAVDDRDLPGAYGLLSSSAQAAQPYQAWASGFVTTVAVEVGAVHELARSEDGATIAAQVRAYDNVDGRIVATLWDVAWTVVQTPAGWRLAGSTANQLDRWELPYYR